MLDFAPRVIAIVPTATNQGDVLLEVVHRSEEKSRYDSCSVFRPIENYQNETCDKNIHAALQNRFQDFIPILHCTHVGKAWIELFNGR